MKMQVMLSSNTVLPTIADSLLSSGGFRNAGSGCRATVTPAGRPGRHWQGVRKSLWPTQAASDGGLGLRLRETIRDVDSESRLFGTAAAAARAAEYSSGPAQAEAPGRRLSGPSLRLGGSESVSLLLSARPVVVLDCRVLGHESGTGRARPTDYSTAARWAPGRRARTSQSGAS